MKETDNTLTRRDSTVHAAKLAADVVFVLRNAERLDHAALIARFGKVLRKYGQHSQVMYAELDDLKAIARKLYAVFATQNTQDAAVRINDLLFEYAHPPRLSAQGNTPWQLHLAGTSRAPWAEWFAASSALALATLLADKQRSPAGLCASSICGRPFVDLGKGIRRSYCSQRCATRERVAAYRQAKKFGKV